MRCPDHGHPRALAPRLFCGTSHSPRGNVCRQWTESPFSIGIVARARMAAHTRQSRLWDKTMKIRVLGCSGGIGGGLRTTAMLVDHDILVDAGTGVGDLSL